MTQNQVVNFPSLIIKSRHAQVAIEFLMISGAAIFFTVIFLAALQNSNQEKISEQQNIQLKEIALTVQNEINLASESSNGYSRQFKIPKKSGNQDYEIIIDAGIIYIKTTNNKHALAIPVSKVIGNITKSQNKIEKISGEIYLNQ